MSIEFELIISFSEVGHAFVVEVPGLTDCMADGHTYEEAVINAQTVIEQWIETAQETGRPVPGRYSVTENDAGSNHQ